MLERFCKLERTCIVIHIDTVQVKFSNQYRIEILLKAQTN